MFLRHHRDHMMEARNSAGRKIDLLCSASDVVASRTHRVVGIPTPPSHPEHQLHRGSWTLPPLDHSRTSSSSCTSTPCLSPQTPQLVRSDSSDSSRTNLASPSPSTPLHASFDQQRHPAHHQKQPSQHHRLTAAYHPYAKATPSYLVQPRLHRHSSSKMDDPTLSLYPPIPDATGPLASAYPMPSMNAQLPLQSELDSIAMSMYRSSNSPASEPSLMSSISAASTANTSNTTSNTKAVPKKNQYPCPMAKQFNCTDYFTTSGHAARHAKKHTGKKDAFCPECNKAFTRKDNMEQHRRTHQTGRGTGRTSDDKVKKNTKTLPKKSSVVNKHDPLLETAVEQQLATQQHEQQQSQQQTHQGAAVAAQMQAAVDAQLAAAQLQQQHAALEAAMMPSAAGPYFLSSLDSGPIPALPMPAMNDLSVRPPLFRSNLTSSIDYIPPLIGGLDLDPLSYSYPSPGLSSGLNSLALAASEQHRLSEDKNAQSPPASETEGAISPLQETPVGETPSESP